MDQNTAAKRAGELTDSKFADKTSPEQPSRVILVVEATAAAAQHHKTARKWVELLLTRLDADARSSRPASSAPGNSGSSEAGQPGDNPGMQYGLVVYGTWDHTTQAPVQFGSWCNNLSELKEWLNGIQFVGGAHGRTTETVALSEALAQAVVMSKCPYPDGTLPIPAGALQRH
jgi:hypothetical protein